MKRTCYFLVFLLSFCVAEGFGQIDTASIEGRVADSSGASVVGATVDVMNVETNYTYHAVSNRDGEWSISPVHIGTYRVSVSAAGFQKSLVDAVTLDVQFPAAGRCIGQAGRGHIHCRGDWSCIAA